MDSVFNRYAIALLSVAKEENKVKEYIEEVTQLIDIISSNCELLLLLKNYGLSKNEKKETLTACFKKNINQYILNLMYVIVDNNRGGYLIDILNEFVKIALNSLNVKKGIVFTTILLSKEQLMLMEKKVSELLNANVILENILDKDLIGGFKVQVEDYIIDDSLKTRLDKLKETIIIKKGKKDDNGNKSQ